MESVWDYPRPPRLERVDTRVTVEFGGVVIADTTRALRMLETSHPPTWYLPPDDVLDGVLVPAGQGAICEWKGAARSWTLRVGDRVAERAAWSYPNPTARYAELKDHLAFYCGPMDRCTVGGVEAAPQPGAFYGGWITPDLKGPFKGGPGTLGW
ncbi:DUF427 domain-containing protein [Gaopeijia maritima]|uniref:DUF427 domain-containing protein n=1 Tax=Gaopeijia maritima TaxID=3119007 RepID=A0ABU9E4I2_9BACT